MSQALQLPVEWLLDAPLLEETDALVGQTELRPLVLNVIPRVDATVCCCRTANGTSLHAIPCPLCMSTRSVDPTFCCLILS